MVWSLDEAYVIQILVFQWPPEQACDVHLVEDLINDISVLERVLPEQPARVKVRSRRISGGRAASVGGQRATVAAVGVTAAGPDACPCVSALPSPAAPPLRSCLAPRPSPGRSAGSCPAAPAAEERRGRARQRAPRPQMPCPQRKAQVPFVGMSPASGKSRVSAQSSPPIPLRLGVCSCAPLWVRVNQAGCAYGYDIMAL